MYNVKQNKNITLVEQLQNRILKWQKETKLTPLTHQSDSRIIIDANKFIFMKRPRSSHA
jgi:hypothetical protein